MDGRHTATGAPLLAGDPHLAFGFPGIWYLARIETPDGVLAGATAPGVPFLVLGHNGHIAWTFTTTGADVQDVFIETPAGDGEYQTPDGPRPFTVREERIKVRGEPDQMLTVRETRHGPVISDLLRPQRPDPGRGDGQPGARQHRRRRPARAQPGARCGRRRQGGRDDHLAGAEPAGGRPQRIALYVTGRVPIRRAGDGSAPVPGDGSHDWIGWASGEQLPHIVAPASGRLVNANDRVAPPDFPVFLGRDWFGDWRATPHPRAARRSDRHTPADFARMQVDVHRDFARQVLAGAAGRARSPQDTAPARPGAAARLGRQHDDGRAAAADLQRLDAAFLRPRAAAGRDRRERRRSAAGIRRLRAVSGRRALVRRRLHQHAAGVAGRRRRATSRAASATIPTQWRWGEAHPAVFAHPMLRAAARSWDRSPRSRIPSPGDDTTVDRGGPAYKQFQSVHGAEYRGVYDLADLDRSLFMMAPGQSGNLLSRHARDFLHPLARRRHDHARPDTPTQPPQPSG